ncbi:MAG: 4Fe-4S dicluster domain-containing protein [Eggerthellaceae bacterium]|nr:4Fe-4S dicluster domain-containing protein [Eggerthellaceae bacterium]
MTRFGMLINEHKCIGCFACRTACQHQNNLLPDMPFVRFEEKTVGSYPNVDVETYPIQCMHCEDAPCVSVCPTHASYIVPESGSVQVDQDKCIGCLYCMAACPYQVRVRNSETGAVDKCHFCNIGHYKYGKEMTTCVTACPTGVRVFGDLDDPDCDLVKEIARTDAQPIAGDLTKAKIFYVR